jgi:S1-C subfamily serine protease
MAKRLIALLLISTLGYAASPESVIRHSQDKVVKLGIVLQRTSPDTNEQEYAHGTCSGAFINDSGLVLTCAHCVTSRFLTKLFVKTENEDYRVGYVVKISTNNDLALVQMLTDKPTPYFKLGREVERGQEVLLFGSPLRLQHTVSVGYIENIFDKGFLGMNHVLAINSAPINGGNSGGPLVDLHGRLVGVGEGSVMANIFVPADGLGFAVDLESIKEFLKGTN